MSKALYMYSLLHLRGLTQWNSGSFSTEIVSALAMASMIAGGNCWNSFGSGWDLC